MGHTLDVAAGFVGARMHVNFRRGFVLSLDHLTFKIGHHHVVCFNDRPADRVRQDQQVIGARNAHADMSAVIDQAGVEQHPRRHRQDLFELS